MPGQPLFLSCSTFIPSSANSRKDMLTNLSHTGVIGMTRVGVERLARPAERSSAVLEAAIKLPQ